MDTHETGTFLNVKCILASKVSESTTNYQVYPGFLFQLPLRLMIWAPSTHSVSPRWLDPWTRTAAARRSTLVCLSPYGLRLESLTVFLHYTHIIHFIVDVYRAVMFELSNVQIFKTETEKCSKASKSTNRKL